jgi:hypothetical protein
MEVIPTKMLEQVIGERECVALMNMRPCSGSGAVQRELAQLEAAELALRAHSYR